MDSSSELQPHDEAEAARAAPPTDATYRAAFTAWLGALGNEARELSSLLTREEAPEPLRRFGAEALNQLLHAVDLVPEGVEALGYLEALFAFRLLAREACDASTDLPAADASGTLGRLAGEAELVRAFLGSEDYSRISAIVRGQSERSTRGRSSAELLASEEARAAAQEETRSWADGYRPPVFGSGSHDLVRLRSFLQTRARRAPSAAASRGAAE